jgi:hypothetical protein
MNARSTSLCCTLAVLIASSVAPNAVRAADEEDVKAAFTSFQAAIKAADHEKIWLLVDTATQADADKYAKTVQTSYGKAGDDEKAKLEKAFGLSADEMSKITGKLYLKSKPFIGKYHEVPGSKIDKVTIEGDKATVNYTEEDGDKEKLQLVKQDGKWKLSVRVK